MNEQQNQQNRDLRNRLDEVFNRIELARTSVNMHHIVKLLAVTKYSQVDVINQLYSLGQRAFGENKVQDFKTKQEDKNLKNLPIEWHFIGNLQKNKINNLIANKPFLCHSLSSFELAEAINSRLETNNKKMNCLFQINAPQETNKWGFQPQEAIEKFHEISEKFQNIKLKGLMSMGANTDNLSDTISSFESTRKIYEKLQQNKDFNLSILSMGMSKDFEVAIKEGSNLVRLGSVLVK
jgi:pyridoxal phosphate enzyme (YggS family)